MTSYTCCQAQNVAVSDSLKSENELIESTEEVDGLIAFAGFIGKRLYESVSSQFDEEKPEEKKTINRVRIKLGPIKIERIEKK